jgi:5-formyltetrahydrofolate cyclo-ligase
VSAFTKAALRQHYLTQRRRLSPDALEQGSLAIAQAFLSLPRLSDGQTVHIFLPILAQNEVNTWLLIKQLRQHYPNIQIAVSRSDFAHNTLQHFLLTPETPLLHNRWGIPEPPITAPPIAVTALDWIVLPLLCFDQRGYRVGYGKGFYDRFLAECRPDAQKVGVALFPPIAAISDIHQHDIAMDFCLQHQRIWHWTRTD